MFDLVNTNIKDSKKFENYLEKFTFIDVINSTNIATGEILEYPKKHHFTISILGLINCTLN